MLPCQYSWFLVIEANYGHCTHFAPTGTKLRIHDKSLSSTSLCVAKSIATVSEHLVKVVLEPSDIWAKTGKLPHSVNLLVPVGVGAVSVALDSDCLHAGVGVLLMRHA